MKRYGLLLGTLLLGSVAMTGCSKGEQTTEAYKHIQTDAALESSGEEASAKPENTAPTQSDNEAETQNLDASEVSKKEETTSTKAAKASKKEDAGKGTENQTTSNNEEVTNKQSISNNSGLKATAKPESIVESGSCTQAPVITKRPVVTKKPVVTKRPVATKAPVVTKKPVATKAPANDSNTDSGSSISSNASKVLAIVNEERAKNGLGALTTTTALNNAATKRAKEIVSTFSHTRPNGTSGVTVLAEYNISYRAWGENIAYGQRSASEVMNSWMNSEGHRKNILSSNFGKVGIGCYEQNGVLYWTQVFTN